MLASTVREAASRFGDVRAFVAADGWPVSYAALDRLSDEAAVGLAALGVSEGDLVALALPSTPDYAIAYAALAKLGAVAAGINPRSTAAERAAVLEVARPALVLASPVLAEGIPEGMRVELVEIAGDAEGLLGTIRAGHAGTSPPVLLDDPERLVTIVFTSGTTGIPKGAMFGERELAAVAMIDTGGEWARPGTTGGAMLSGTQLAHIGFMTKLPWYLQRAMTLHLIDRWRAADVLRMIADEHMASIGGVAPQLALLLRQPDFDQHDLSAVKTIVMGGALSPPALVREARERIGASYSIRYSSTESGGVGTATAFDADEDEALFTVGRPRPGIQVEIRDEDDRPLAAGQIGEICFRSPTQLRGYWRDPEATAATLRDGWVHSGDLGFLDPAGCLRLAGRAKEMYIRGGYNVYPLEVEAVLASHPDVAEIVVAPRPDPVMGEIGVAVVVPRDPAAPPTLDELRAYGAERLSAHKLPEDLRLVDQVPLTPMQKVDRKALAEHERRATDAATLKAMAFRNDRRRSSPDGLLPSVGHKSSRLEAFSDGVLAIAITLLILEVGVPEAEPGGLASALAHQWPSYAAYALTFLVIGIMWVNHHELFDGVDVVTRSLMFLNILLLMTIAFLPFPTALMAEYLREGRNSHIATAIYGANMALIGVGFLVIWFYLSRNPDLMVEGLDADEARQSMRRTLPGPIIYGATIGLAYVWAPACLVVYAAMALYFMLWRPSQVDEVEGRDAVGETADQPAADA